MNTIIIFALAFFVRIYNISLLPLNHDEANWMIPCVDNFDKFFGIPVACFGGYIRPFLSYFVIFTQKIFTSPEYIVRIPAVIFGVATIILTFKLGEELYNKKCGWLSAAILSFLPWHIIQSRDGREMILNPFFGCLIILFLIRFLKKKNSIWFILSWIMLGVSAFYTYPASILYIPIFLVILLLLRRKLKGIGYKTILLGVMAFFITIFPLIYHAHIMKQIVNRAYWYYYSNEIFKISLNNILLFLGQFFKNFQSNNLQALRILFLASEGQMLYAASLQAPLLITKIILPVALVAIFVALKRRNSSDKILLTWLFLGYIGGISGVRFLQPRHIIIIIVPLLILMSSFIAEALQFVAANCRNLIKRKFLILSINFLCFNLVFMGILQFWDYFQTAPTNFEECRRNSYGCEEAARYLAKVPGINNSQVISDARMTLCTYLKYLDKGIPCRERIPDPENLYYVVWAPQSHPREYWDVFSHTSDFLMRTNPEAKPIKTIYYPNGIVAIDIFKLKGKQ